MGYSALMYCFKQFLSKLIENQHIKHFTFFCTKNNCFRTFSRLNKSDVTRSFWKICKKNFSKSHPTLPEWLDTPLYPFVTYWYSNGYTSKTSNSLTKPPKPAHPKRRGTFRGTFAKLWHKIRTASGAGALIRINSSTTWVNYTYINKNLCKKFGVFKIISIFANEF